MRESKEPKNYMFVNVRFYQANDYNNFRKLCESKDLTVTRAINGLVKNAIRENKLPFSEA